MARSRRGGRGEWCGSRTDKLLNKAERQVEAMEKGTPAWAATSAGVGVGRFRVGQYSRTVRTGHLPLARRLVQLLEVRFRMSLDIIMNDGF